MTGSIAVTLFFIPSVICFILYVCSWNIKNKIFQALFGILAMIIPGAAAYFLNLWLGSNDLSNILLMDYVFLSVLALIYSPIRVIILKKSKKQLPIIPLVIGLILIVPFVYYLFIQFVHI